MSRVEIISVNLAMFLVVSCSKVVVWLSWSWLNFSSSLSSLLHILLTVSVRFRIISDISECSVAVIVLTVGVLVVPCRTTDAHVLGWFGDPE